MLIRNTWCSIVQTANKFQCFAQYLACSSYIYTYTCHEIFLQLPLSACYFFILLSIPHSPLEEILHELHGGMESAERGSLIISSSQESFLVDATPDRTPQGSAKYVRSIYVRLGYGGCRTNQEEDSSLRLQYLYII